MPVSRARRFRIAAMLALVCVLAPVLAAAQKPAAAAPEPAPVQEPAATAPEPAPVQEPAATAPASAPAQEPAATAPAAPAAPEPAAIDHVPVRLTTRVEPKDVSIGTPFRFTIRVEADPGVEVAVPVLAE